VTGRPANGRRGGACAAAVLAFVAGCGSGAPGPAESLRRFAADAVPIARTDVTAEDGGWRVTRAAPGPVPLFEVADPAVENAVLLYRARMRAEGVTGKAYLEMWVRIPGRGEFFSRGLAQPLQGTSGWASYEIPFFLNEPGLRPDLVKLNVAFEHGGGTVWVKDVELLRAALSG
jgi:hypothetical protein